MNGAQGPFKGLASFEDTARDAELFFGREREREIVMANVLASRLTVLYGDTGVGKSSVLRAGVARDLRMLPEPLAVVVFGEWQDDPAGALEARVAEVTGGEVQGSLGETLEIGAAVVGGEVFVLLDGLEEEFLYHGSEVGPGSFFDEFSKAATRQGLRASFLLAVREDGLAKLDRFKGRVPNVFGNYLRLDHLDRAAGREAIRGPIDRYNQSSENGTVGIEPALVEAVLDQVAAGRLELGGGGRGAVRENGRVGERIEAPYLQLVMARLWESEAEAGSRVLRLETLHRLGGAREIVRDHLEGALDSLPPEQQDVAADLFHHLVTPSGTKVAHDASDLAGYLDAKPLELEPVLATLAAQRILRPVPGARGSDLPRYEIYHDILADPILAWRALHESDREIDRVRTAAASRHRRLLIVAAAALLLAGAMAGVTIFALTQRSEAQKQAARARHETALAKTNEAKFRIAANEAALSLEKARREEKKAIAAEKNAVAAEKAAVAAETRAATAEQKAKHETQVASKNAAAYKQASATATTNEQKALQEKQLADANYKKAKDETVLAKRATKQANENLAAAKAARARADKAKARADKNATRARAQALAATSLTELSSAPEQAVNDALQSVELDPTSGAENVLRSALGASWVHAILPGQGIRSASIGSTSAGAGSIRTHAMSFDATGARAVAVATSLLAVGDSEELRLYRIPSGKLVRTLRVGSAATHVAFSPDGSLVAAASPNGFVTLWNVATGRRLYAALSHAGRPVADLAFSPDGKLLATACNDKKVRIWDVATGTLALAPVQHPRAVSLVSFSPDDRWLLTVDGADARLIDVANGQIIATMAGPDSIRTAAFSPDGTLVATGGTGSHATVQLWSVPDGKVVGKLVSPGNTGDVLDVSFSRDGKLLVTASADDTARIWSVADRVLLAMLVGHGNQVRTAVFSPDSKWIVTASRDGTARVWDTNGDAKTTLAGDSKPLTSAFFTPDGRWVVSTAEDTARVWDPGTAPELKLLRRQSGPIRRVAVSPDGKLALSAGDDGTVKVGPVSGGPEATFDLGGHITAASWSTDGKLILAASDNGLARVWRISDGKVLRTIDHGAPVRSAAFDKDATRVVTGGDDGFARIWNITGGRPLAALHHGGGVNVASFSPDDSLIATAGADGRARLWRADDFQLARTFEGHTGAVVAMQFSPDGNWLATGSKDKTARIWSIRGHGVTVLRGHKDAITALAFSPDSARLVTASRDHDAIVWHVPDGRRLLTLSGQSAEITDVAFSFDGRWIATAGPTTAGLWNVTLRVPSLVRLHGSGKQLTSVAFSPSEWRLLTGSMDGTVATYNCRLCGGIPQLVAMAKARLALLGHGLTPAQRKRYLG